MTETDVKRLVAQWRAIISNPLPNPYVSIREMQSVGTAMANALESLSSPVANEHPAPAKLIGAELFSAMVKDELDAIQRSAPSVVKPEWRDSVPEGWQLVPKEPTQVMSDAAIAQYNCSPRIGKMWGADFVDIWRAALAAAPSPQTEGGER